MCWLFTYSPRRSLPHVCTLLFFRKVVDIIHPGVANVSKTELGEMIAKVSQCVTCLSSDLRPVLGVRVCLCGRAW